MFLLITEKITLELLQKYQNLDPVIRQIKSWHKYKIKPIKADITILGYKKNFLNISKNLKIPRSTKKQMF